MPFQAAVKPATDVRPAPPSTEPPGLRGAGTGGYDAQAAALRPAPPTVQKKKGGESDRFDPWKLSPEVKTLFVELGQTEDSARVEQIMNELTAAPHSVPKATVQQVIAANQGFFSKTWDAIKGGSWHTASTDEQGNITSIFKLDGKGLGWDNPTWSFDANFKDAGATYRDKDDNWHVTGGYKDKVGTVSGAAGTKEEGLHTWKVTGGKSGGTAAYSHQEGETVRSGKAGVALADGQTTVNGSYDRKDKDSSTHVGGKVLVGDKTGASGVYRTTEGKDSREIKGGYVHTEGQHTVDGAYVRKTEGGSTAVTGQALVGDKTGGSGTYRVVEGKETTEYKAGHVLTGEQHTTNVGYSRKDEKSSESVSGQVFSGPKTGASGVGTVEREGYGVTIKGDGTETINGDKTTTTAGGSVVYTDKPEKDAKGKPKEGDGFQIRASGRVTRTENEASGDGSTKVEVAGGVTSGKSDTNVGYTGLTGTRGGVGFNVHEFRTDWSNQWDLDEAAKEGLSLKIGGNLRLTDKEGEENTYTGDLTGRWFKGKGDDSQELKFRLLGGYDSIGNIGKLSHATSDMLGGDQGYGHFAHGAATFRDGKKQYGLDMTYGQTPTTSLVGGHFGYQNGDEHKFDLYASMAKSDAATATLLKGTGEFALRKNLTLTAGGQYTMKPGEDGYNELWHVYSGLDLNLRKGMDLTLKMGVASNGENIYYVPEAMFELEKKFSVGAMAAITPGGQTTVGGKLSIDKANLTIFGGYGDMGAITNPYQGNSGMQMPGLDSRDAMRHDLGGGGFIGVQWNALPTLKKLFGGG